jgi:iron complex outermembrane receptor protein
LIQLFTAEGPPVPEVGGEVWGGSYGSWRAALRPAGPIRSGQLRRRFFALHDRRVPGSQLRDARSAERSRAPAAARRLEAELRRNALNQVDTQDPLGLTRAQAEANPRQSDAAATTFNTRKSIGHAQFGTAWDKRLPGGDTLQLSGYFGERDVRQYLALSGAAITSSGGVVNLERIFSGIGLRWGGKTDLGGRAIHLFGRRRARRDARAPARLCEQQRRRGSTAARRRRRGH